MAYLRGSALLLTLVAAILPFYGISCKETSVALERSARSSSSDTSVEFFLRQTLTNLKSVMSTGFPQFGLPPLDPLMAGDADVVHDRGGTRIQAKFNNLLVIGLSTFEIRQLHVSRSRLQMDLELLFPKLTINGWYNMTGKVARLFPLYGHGRFEAEATQVTLSGMSALNIGFNGRLSLLDLTLDMTVDKVRAHFHDLLGGGPLSGAANGVLNLFGKKIFNSAKPKLLDNLKRSLQKNLDSKLKNFDASAF